MFHSQPSRILHTGESLRSVWLFVVTKSYCNLASAVARENWLITPQLFAIAFGASYTKH